MATSTIKLLPTSASVRAFSGTDVDYSAREFIRQCEDVMTNSFVTDNGDEIAFVLSRLQQCQQKDADTVASASSVPLCWGEQFLEPTCLMGESPELIFL